MSNAKNLSKLHTLASHIANLVGLSNSKTAIDAKVSEQSLPAGTVLDFAGAEVNIPTGYLACDGRAVSRTTYAALFSAIGTTHGVGNGTTTFNLPDTRGRVVAGVDNMGGTAANRLTTAGGGVNGAALGSTGGGETHTLTTAQMPAHNHTASTDTAAAHTHSYNVSTTSLYETTGYSGVPFSHYTNGDSAPYMQTQETPAASTSGTGGSHSHVVTVNNNGSGNAHPNVQPTIVFNKIIKT